jgi:hypothetical protein
MLYPKAAGLRPALLLFLAGAAFAGQTRTWSESDYSEFEKGNLKNLSLRSDGVITLAPKFQELYDSSSAYLWSLARDSKGNLYTGGGPGAKLYRISSKGEKKMLAELDGLEIHAVAVDSKDRVYAATAPDGKVFRVAANGKCEVFYNPKQKYIWAMAFDSHGNLFVATGDQGEIHKVTPEGKGSVFFKTEELHARSMALDARDNLFVGTDPGGLVMRVTPAGEGFVLYQMSKKEVTAVAVGKDGSIYAAAVGVKQPTSTPAPASTPAATPPSTGSSMGGNTITVRAASPPPATMGGSPIGISGGSEFYRIDSSGNPQRLWGHSQEIIYAIAFDADGHPLLGTGNKGFIYRIDSPTLYTALLNSPPTQITALLDGPNGSLYAASGNVGKVYQIGPGLEKEGRIESDVFDAGFHSMWGRLEFRGNANGGSIAVTARTGNLDQPHRNWSPWSNAVSDSKGARVNAPAARFAQWKATLTAGSTGTPELEEVDFAYLPRNVAPRIDLIETTPPNYRFPATLTTSSSAAQTLTLPALGKHQSSSSSTSSESSGSSMQFSKGSIGARWAASDDNGDSLIYKVEIRGKKEKQWKLLKDRVKEKYISFDSTAFPDGEYLLRITASDSPGNPPDLALSTQMESDPFLVDNTPPAISGLKATHNGANLTVHWKAVDALNEIRKAEYSLDGGEWTIVAPTGRLSDSLELDYDLVLQNAAAGEHTIAVRVEDEYGNQATGKTVVE